MKLLPLIFAAFLLTLSTWADETYDLLWSSKFVAPDPNPDGLYFESTNGLINAPNTTLDRLITNSPIRSTATNCTFAQLGTSYYFAPVAFRNWPVSSWEADFTLQNIRSFLNSGGKITSISFDMFGFTNGSEVSLEERTIWMSYLRYSYLDDNQNFKTNSVDGGPMSFAPGSSPSNTQKMTFNISDDFFQNVQDGLSFTIDFWGRGGDSQLHVGIANMEVHGTLPIPEPSGALLGLFSASFLSLSRRRK